MMSDNKINILTCISVCWDDGETQLKGSLANFSVDEVEV